MELGLILLTKNEQRRRYCCLFSIDVRFPKLDVAGSIPVSRSFVFQSLTVIGPTPYAIQGLNKRPGPLDSLQESALPTEPDSWLLN